MSLSVSLVCYIIALIVFVIAAFKVPTPVSLTDVGLAFLTAGFITA